METIQSYNIPVETVADYFLCKVDEGEELLTKLKLQKLLYYAQGFVMAITNHKLFNEKILAWTHGPAVDEIYKKYKDVEGNSIEKPKTFDTSAIEKNEELQEILDEVYGFYGQFSAWKLRGMTHEESPWIETPQSSEITDDKMLTFFKTLIN